MENTKLYLCTKTAEGDLFPFYEINGSFFSRKSEQGGSVFNMDDLISNINTVKFEEKTKKLKNEEVENVPDIDLTLKQEEPVVLQQDEPVLEENEETAGTEIKFKSGERQLPTKDIEDSIWNYLNKNDY